MTNYAELMLFLLSAMIYINSMDERNVFQALRSYLVSKEFSLRIVFWVTGLLAFLISFIADKLTTALLMGAIVMTVAKDDKKFIAITFCCCGQYPGYVCSTQHGPCHASRSMAPCHPDGKGQGSLLSLVLRLELP